MRGVELWVGSKSRPGQKISIEVMKLLMENMEVAVKGKFSMLERGYLTKKKGLLHGLFCGIIKGERGVHNICSGIAASHEKMKGGSPGNCGNTSDGYFKGGTDRRHHLQALVNETD